MRNKLKLLKYLLVMGFAISQTTNAQRVKRQTIGSYGSNASFKSAIAGQTIGQPYSTNIYSDDKASLAPGFQQPVRYLRLSKPKGPQGLDNNLHIKMYPNPASARFVIESEEVVNNALITVKDINGRLMVSEQISDLTQHEINCSSWRLGIYFISVRSSDNQYTHISKLIIY